TPGGIGPDLWGRKKGVMIEETKLAADLAARLNRSEDLGRRRYHFQVVEESFRVIRRRELGGGRVEVFFEFQGLVQNLDEPVTYLAAGSVVVGPEGEIEEGTLRF
ncbi:MAG: hypothetical protein AB1896_21370, partial [Thermodesulfobacteriota bacterium]